MSLFTTDNVWVVISYFIQHKVVQLPVPFVINKLGLGVALI